LLIIVPLFKAIYVKIAVLSLKLAFLGVNGPFKLLAAWNLEVVTPDTTLRCIDLFIFDFISGIYFAFYSEGSENVLESIKFSLGRFIEIASGPK